MCAAGAHAALQQLIGQLLGTLCLLLRTPWLAISRPLLVVLQKHFWQRTLYTKLRRSSGEHVIRQTGSIRTCRAGHEGQHWLWQHVHSAYDQANLHTRLACVCAQSTP